MLEKEGGSARPHCLPPPHHLGLCFLGTPAANSVTGAASVADLGVDRVGTQRAGLALLGPPRSPCIHMSKCVITPVPAGGRKNVPGGWGGAGDASLLLGRGPSAVCSGPAGGQSAGGKEAAALRFVPSPPPSAPTPGYARCCAPGTHCSLDSSVMKHLHRIHQTDWGCTPMA